MALPKRIYLLGIPATHTSSTACASPLSPSLAQLTDRGSSHRLGSIGCRLLGSGRAVAGWAPPSTARHSSARWSCILFLPGDPLCRLPLKVTLRRSDCLGCLDPSRLKSRPHLTSAKKREFASAALVGGTVREGRGAGAVLNGPSRMVRGPSAGLIPSLRHARGWGGECNSSEENRFMLAESY